MIAWLARDGSYRDQAGRRCVILCEECGAMWGSPGDASSCRSREDGDYQPCPLVEHAIVSDILLWDPGEFGPG